MKKTALILAVLICLPGLSRAADAAAPVRDIMDATVKNWSGADSDWIDIFGDDMLGRLYSRDFVAKYRAAAEKPAADEDGISPFDYDVIVNGQDACPLEDLSIAAQPAAGSTTEVVTTFKKATCMDDASDRQALTTVRFEVIEEGGKPVVDDIMTEGDAGQTNSLKATMMLIAKDQ
jgi:hypothetical protein